MTFIQTHTTIQMTQLRITDNANDSGRQGWALERCLGCYVNQATRNAVTNDLKRIGGKTLAELNEEDPDLLVFPYSLGDYKDGIEDLRICTYSEIHDRIFTGNLMGFVGVNDTQLSITSRFTSQGEDHFLHYMIAKVFCPNIFNLKHEVRLDSAFDFLLFMFPHYLNEAMSQGFFKEYRCFMHNDSKVNGTIDLSRHIRKNIPFNGNIAYRTREFSYDNHITQLVRHTIEYIKRSGIGTNILSERKTRNNVRTIIENTSYNLSDRRMILAANNRAIRHPFYTKYTALQKICMAILRHEKLKYGAGKDKIYGILFDGAWLWEEFLDTIFQSWGLTHSENKTGLFPVYLFQNNEYVRYPDFYLINKVVIDAKYKHLGNGRDIARDDIHQLISYIHVLQAGKAFFAYPSELAHTGVDVIGKLNGLVNEEVGLLRLHIPQSSESFYEFSKEMDEEIGKLESYKKQLML